MKKRLFLVNYEFTTGGERYSDYELVTIKFDKLLGEEEGRKAAEKTAERWFKERGTDAELISVVAKTTRELIYWPDNKVCASTPKDDAQVLRDLRNHTLDDCRDAETLPLDRVLQLLAQEADGTDMLVLKNLMPGDIIEELEQRGFYVNTMIDESRQDDYTVIRWDKK